MTVIEAHPDAIAVKLETEKRWADSAIGRTEHLAPWKLTRTGDGSLFLSVQAHGPDPAHVLDRFASLHSDYMDNRPGFRPGDQMPVLDASVPGRTACVWRSNGVWVEVWYKDRESVS